MIPGKQRRGADTCDSPLHLSLVHLISRADAACGEGETRPRSEKREREETGAKVDNSRKGRRKPRVPMEKLRTGGTAPFLKRDEAWRMVPSPPSVMTRSIGGPFSVRERRVRVGLD